MYFCLFVQFDMSSTFARLKFSRFSATNFEDDFSVFPFSPFRKGRNFYRETLMVDDFSMVFSGANAPLLMYICKLT